MSNAAIDYKSLEALFWPSERADSVSAWHGHVSFAHWLVSTTRPKVVVELGTHNGVSYASFCNAVARNALPTRCFAIDTWEGDDQAGFYGEDVFVDLDVFNRSRYSEFSKLLRCRFDEALPQFQDSSIDLLHIDGLHTYSAVKHDYETWLPKLSDSAIVLFHDTNVRQEGFGVWQLWSELSQRYPGLEFVHSAGLGMLAVGQSQPSAISAVCRLAGDSDLAEFRTLFERASLAAQRNGLYEGKAWCAKVLREIEAQGVNIALHKPAWQSSRIHIQQTSAQGAVNGRKTGHFGFHTDFESNPWWMLDLGAVEEFDEVVIYNRLDAYCRERARNLILSASDDGESWRVLHYNDGLVFGGIDGYPLRVRRPGTQARFLRIKLPGTEHLHLDQVEVYRFGPNPPPQADLS